MATSMLEALKAAGIVPTNAEPKMRMSREVPTILPFEKQWDMFGGYDSVSQQSYEDMNFLLDTWEPLEEGELDDYEVRYGGRIRDVLKKYIDKVRVFEVAPLNYGCCCLEFYVMYYPSIQTLQLHRINTFTYEKWCEEFGQEPRVQVDIFSHTFGDRLKIFEHYCEMSDIIPLRYVPADCMWHHLDRPYKFRDIASDSGLMTLLEDYLTRVEFAPNPNKWYMVCHKEQKKTLEEVYWLKKATDTEINSVLETM